MLSFNMVLPCSKSPVGNMVILAFNVGNFEDLVVKYDLPPRSTFHSLEASEPNRKMGHKALFLIF